MTARLSSLTAHLKTLKIDAIFVSDPVNIRYLTQYRSEDSWLLVLASKTFYLTDFRYVAQARKALKGIQVVHFKVSPFETALELARSVRARSLGFEEGHVTYQAYGRLKKAAGKTVSLRALSGAVEALRVIKDAGEIRLIREAVAVNLKGFSHIRSFIRPGVTERALLYELQDFARQEDAAFSFDPIIASGPNSAYPHARVTDRILKAGEPLLLDFGLEKEGYKSDLTRMFFLGKMSRSFDKQLSIIKEAQQAAFQVIKPGVLARDVDAAARNYLAKVGLANHFGHSLGHGVGLDIHEMPRLSDKSGVVLQEGMVVTVEPGIYFPGKYGVRQEEMVLITKNACEVLSGYRDHGSCQRHCPSG